MYYHNISYFIISHIVEHTPRPTKFSSVSVSKNVSEYLFDTHLDYDLMINLVIILTLWPIKAKWRICIICIYISGIKSEKAIAFENLPRGHIYICAILT